MCVVRVLCAFSFYFNLRPRVETKNKMSTKRRFITFQSLETGATVDRESDGLRISHQAKLSYGWLSFFFLFSAVVLFSLFRTIGQQRVVKETPRQQQSCARLPGRRCCDSRCCRLTTSKRFNFKKKEDKYREGHTRKWIGYHPQSLPTSCLPIGRPTPQ